MRCDVRIIQSFSKYFCLREPYLVANVFHLVCDLDAAHKTSIKQDIIEMHWKSIRKIAQIHLVCHIRAFYPSKILADAFYRRKCRIDRSFLIAETFVVLITE